MTHLGVAELLQASQTWTGTEGLTNEWQMQQIPSHFSQTRPIDTPGCLRHKTKSGLCLAMGDWTVDGLWIAVEA